ncbi:MAG: SLBB domain-containing protein [Armatimonadetes bacterium]|nr:SLBB domain-containing protein [Armatimonadota bacterium]
MIRTFLALMLVVAVALPALSQQRLKAGDSVRITVEEDASLSRVYVVNQSGNLMLPLIGMVKAEGLTLDELAQTVARLLIEGRFFTRPTVKAELATSGPKAITIEGAVRTSGKRTVKPTDRLADALEPAAPFEDADLTAIEIKAASGATKRVNFAKFKADGDQSQNPLLQDGDTIIVPLRPQENKVMILGAVARPGVQPWAEGDTLAVAVAKAGGPTSEADATKIRLKRKDGTATEVDLAKDGDLALGPGDEALVPIRAARAFIVVRGAVRNAGVVNHAAGMTITQALDAAGGPAEDARLDKVVIERPEGRRTKKIHVNVMQIAQGGRTDEPLQAGDTVMVPGAPKERNVGDIVQVVGAVISLIFLLGRR